MKVEQYLYQNEAFILNTESDILNPDQATMVLAFGAKGILLEKDIYQLLRDKYPIADIITCSTSGEVYGDAVYDDTVTVVAVQFEKTIFKPVCINIRDLPDSFEAGKMLFNTLNKNDLRYVLVISDGGLVNGSELVKGIESANSMNIPVTGGLAGDADNFNSTCVGYNRAPVTGNIAAVGFYGVNLEIGHGSLGGWQMFGPEKIVTKSVSNRLFEIDHKSALDLYKQYLGKYANDLPGSALLFPLSVRTDGSNNNVVRTILSINSDEQSMVFAGDIPEGSHVKFMKANFDSLIDAATQAAHHTLSEFPKNAASGPKLALLISCVGRKLILGKRIDEEVEAVKDILGNKTILSGFYSYGEISPLRPASKCELHNQTMTITTFNESL